MSDVIEEMIKEKPHLIDPFRFYEKTLKFSDSVREMNISPLQGRTAYASEHTDGIFKRFSELLELPEGTLSPLKHAMELGEVDFTRLPLGETPAFSLPYGEDDLAMLLYLLGKPYFLALRNERPLDDRTWEEGKCPVCRAQPTLSWIPEDGRRKTSCSFCSTTGYLNRTGCPICLRTDQEKQNVLVFEKEEKFTIHTCNHCHSYVKTVDAGTIAHFSPEVSDLASLPLDLIVQEKGFMRRSPNPIGIRKITSQG